MPASAATVTAIRSISCWFLCLGCKSSQRANYFHQKKYERAKKPDEMAKITDETAKDGCGKSG
jgi:hypothetical protein